MPKTMPAIDFPGKAHGFDQADFRAQLLAWYDAHARVLPWRYPSGIKADPYYVWLSEVMLQQTTVQAVIPYFGKFVGKWPRVHDLAAAPDDEVMTAWAGLGYYARARNLLKCARFIIENHHGIFPATEAALKSLPGIGDYTAAAIASIAYDIPTTVIDGNVDRVISRYFGIMTPLPDSKPEIREKARAVFEGNVSRPGDFAQAMMDLGATICVPKSPKCMICPVAIRCQARRMGIAAELPRQKQKPELPKRAGYVYWITNAKGDVLFEKRPDRGLLGGMTGLPTSEWVALENINHISTIKPGQTESMDRNHRIRHTFTHFHLDLFGISICQADLALQPHQFWVPAAEIGGLGLPTVFKKFVRLMLD